MSENPLYNLITASLPEFKIQFTCDDKVAKKTLKKYFYISSAEAKKTEIRMNDDFYQLDSYHISVYEDIRRYEGKGSAAYHLTMKFVAGQNALTARVYFSANQKIILVVVKDATDTEISLPTYDVLLQFAPSVTESFSNLVHKIAGRYQHKLRSQYDTNIQTLETISKTLGADCTSQNKIIWFRYAKLLGDTIRLITEAKQYLLVGNKFPIDALTKLNDSIRKKMDVSLKLNRMTGPSESAPVTSDESKAEEKEMAPSTVMTAYTNLKAEIQELKRSKQPKWAKLKKEIELYERLFELSNDNDEVLNSIVHVRKMQDQAYQALKAMLSTKNKTNVPVEELECLILIAQQISIEELFLAVTHNQELLISLLVKLHPNIDLNQVHSDSGKTLLEQAYQLKYPKILSLLLQLGAATDLQNSRGGTLLMIACEDNRKEEMLIFLKSNGNRFIRNNAGFTAFGVLTMIQHKPAVLSTLRLYLENLQKFEIDFMQGPEQWRGTPYNFACQMDWVDHATLLLQSGANPTIARETDFMTGLDICAVKNHTKSCKATLDLSQHPLNGIFGKAIGQAKQAGNLSIVKMLEDHVNEKKIDTNKTNFSIGVGASASSLFRVAKIGTEGSLPTQYIYEGSKNRDTGLPFGAVIHFTPPSRTTESATDQPVEELLPDTQQTDRKRDLSPGKKF